MRKWVSLLFIAIIVAFSFSPGSAQMLAYPGALGSRAPFFYVPPISPLYAPAPFATLPLGMPPLLTAAPRPLLAPMGIPQPVRNAAATITIIFNPALSVVNVSAVPIATAVPVVPTVPTAVVPAPTTTPTAIATLLPALLSVPTGPPWTQTQTISTTAIVPTLPAATATIPGLSVLLPFI
ncbi:MAG: hypothetical protein AB1611_06015 [bacterium]